jgi:hypothetical protein
MSSNLNSFNKKQNTPSAGEIVERQPQATKYGKFNLDAVRETRSSLFDGDRS